MEWFRRHGIIEAKYNWVPETSVVERIFLRRNVGEEFDRVERGVGDGEQEGDGVGEKTVGGGQGDGDVGEKTSGEEAGDGGG